MLSANAKSNLEIGSWKLVIGSLIGTEVEGSTITLFFAAKNRGGYHEDQAKSSASRVVPGDGR